MGVNEGQIEWITEEEKGVVMQFREMVGSKLPPAILDKKEDDLQAFLLRWLRARSMNLSKAQSMLLTAMQWRVDNNLEKTLELEVDPFLVETYRWTFVGRDKQGNAVAICPFFEWDFRKAMWNDKLEGLDHFTRHYFESVTKGIEICNRMRKPGEPPVTQFFPVCDVGSMPYGQMLSLTAMKRWFQMAAVYEAYYPEVLFKAIFFNSPFYFQYFLNMFKGIIAPRTLSKMICYSSVDEWRKDVELYMDPKILPVEYGGTREEKAEKLFEVSLQGRLEEMEGIFKENLN